MNNIKYSYQMNMWGFPRFKQIKDFEEWYNKDFTADGSIFFNNSLVK